MRVDNERHHRTIHVSITLGIIGVFVFDYFGDQELWKSFTYAIVVSILLIGGGVYVWFRSVNYKWMALAMSALFFVWFILVYSNDGWSV